MASNDNEVVVRITGDASGVAPAVDLTETSLEGLREMVSGVTAQMAAFTAKTAEDFSGLVTRVNAATASIANMGREATVETGVLAAMGTRVKESWEGLTATMSKFNGVLLGITGALAGGEMFEHAVHASVEWTQANIRLSQSLGITLERASGLHVTLNKLGIETDQVVGASQRLTRQLKAHEGSINDLGVATRDANGHFRDTLDIMVDGMARLNDFQAGVDRTAAAQRLFGRGAGDLTDMLRLTNEQIQEGTRAAHELGLVTTQEGVEAMRNYKDASNEAKDVIEGLEIALGNALLPTLTDLSNWLRANGKEVIQDFKQAFDDAIGAVRWITLSIRENIAQLNVWSAEISGLQEEIQTFCDRVSSTWNLMAKVMSEFPDWGKMKSDWESGMAAIDKTVSDHAAHIEGAINAAKLALAGLDSQLGADGRKAGFGQDSLLGGSPFSVAGLGKQPPLPDTTGGNDRLDNLKDPKSGGGEKKSKDDLVQQLQEELQAKKDAWAQEQLAQDTAQQFSLQSEADFWRQALQRVGLSGKDRLQIETQYVRAAQAVQKEAEDEKLAQMKREITEDGNNQQKKLADLKKLAAEIHRFYGDTSTQAREADQAVADQEKKAAQQSLQAWTDYYKHLEQLRLGWIDDEEAEAQFEVEMGRKSKAQLLDEERQFENQRYAIRLQSALRDKSLIDPMHDPDKYRQVCAEIDTIEQQHQQKLNQIDRQAILQRTQMERQAVGQIAQGWAQAIGEMVTLQQGFAATIKSLWTSVQQAIGQAIESILENMLSKFMENVLGIGAASKASGAIQISDNAAVAASAAFASTAAIPIIGPELAPEAAGAAYAGAIGWVGALGVPGFDVGAWNLSKDQFAMVHAGEMIIPAGLADGMRSMFESTGRLGLSVGLPSYRSMLPEMGANFNAPPAANAPSVGGDGPHLHFHGPIIGSRHAMERWAKDNAHLFGAGGRQFVRNGGSLAKNARR